MSSHKLLANLKNDTYCRLQTSPVHGIGVYAIKPIPLGVDPFVRLGNEPIPTKISMAQFNSLDSKVQKMITDFCQKDGNFWYVPHSGLNGLDISFYLNHSKTPNIKICCSKDTSCFVFFKTIRKIQGNEELFIDYNT